jgi:hypothetical protein
MYHGFLRLRSKYAAGRECGEKKDSGPYLFRPSISGEITCKYSKTAFYRYLGIPFLYGIPVNSQEQLILLWAYVQSPLI